MKLWEVVAGVAIDPRKLTEYALNPENPIGGNKALVFERRLGYTKDNYEGLLGQIQMGALEAEAVLKQADEHGQRYQVDIEVSGVAGQQAIVRTGWIVEPGSAVARLVTLYVRM
jgi:hypothetical protein